MLKCCVFARYSVGFRYDWMSAPAIKEIENSIVLSLVFEMSWAQNRMDKFITFISDSYGPQCIVLTSHEVF
jgi:hypothetical protein